MARIVSVVFFLLVTSLNAPNVGAAIVRTVAFAGQPAPDTEIGTMFAEFGEPVLNNAGQVAFRSDLAGDSIIVAGPDNIVGNSRGLWSEGSGQLHLIAREGSSAPGTDAVFDRFAFNNLRINDAGQTVIGARLFGESVGSFQDTGIWSETGGAGNGLTLIVQERTTPAPGTTAGTLFNSPTTTQGVINSAGRVSFMADLVHGPGVDATNDQGVWSQDSSGNLQLRMRTGDQAPGFDPGVVFSARSIPIFNDAQDFVIDADVAGPGITTANDRGIWTSTGAGLALIARQGDPAPGTNSGETFGAFRPSTFTTPTPLLAINNAGNVAFNATMLGAPSSSDRGVWSNASGELTLVARKGDEAPGAGGNFTNVFDPRINAAGDTAFVAQTTNFLAGSGIWKETDDGLSLVAIQGMQAPGLDDGIQFSSFFHFLDGPTPFVFNGDGEMAFVANLFSPFGSGVTVDGTNNTALYLTIDDVLTSVAREGDLFEVVPGDFRTIAGLFLSAGTGNEDGLQSGFNEVGQLAFRLSFTDGSQGIFVYAVPEPSSLILLATSCLLFLRCRRTGFKNRRINSARLPSSQPTYARRLPN
jgi:hypothetical protein